MFLRTTASILLVATAWIAAPPTLAQTYSSWENPDAETETSSSAADARLQAFIERLRAIVDQAEKDRAADPVLLRDLRALADGYDRPWTTSVLDDAFLDGDYETNPKWIVADGRYWVEKGWGLRNALEEQASSSSGSKEQLAAQIFGQVLTQALGGSTSSSPSGGGTQPTAIYSEANVTNAFSASVSFSSWVGSGRLIMGPWQSADTRAGYRLVYNVGGSIDLVAVSTKGTRVIGSATGPFALEDKAVHEIVWDRQADGGMRVDLDGKTVIETSDRGFRDDFRMWGFASNGGDFIVKSVSVAAAP